MRSLSWCWLPSMMSLLLLAGCGGADVDQEESRILVSNGLEATYSARRAPQVGLNEFDVWLRLDGLAVDGATLEVEPWMATHGHGVSTSPTVEEVEAGHFELKEVLLSMPGRWEIRTDLFIAGKHRAAFAPEVEVQ